MRSTPEEKKRTLLVGFVEGRRNLFSLAEQIHIRLQDQVFLGTWSIRDMLAHLIGWDYSNLEAIQAILSSRLPAFYGFIDKDWRSYNARLVDMYKKGDVPDLIQAGRVSMKVLVERLAELPANDIYKDHGVRYRGYKVTIARLVEAETKDEVVHLEQIQGFLATIPPQKDEPGKDRIAL